MKIPKQPFGNQTTHAYSYRRVSKCLSQCLARIIFKKTNKQILGDRDEEGQGKLELL